MYTLDNHVHTHFSSDGKDHMEKVIQEAIRKGVNYLTITDHLEYNKDGFGMDVNEYIKQLQEYKEKYKKNISILAGVEIGYKSCIKEKIESIVRSNYFDFVLCSTHSIDGKSISKGEYFNGYSQKEAYDSYFKNIIKANKEFKDYDTYGHLDYVIRYGNFKDKKIIYDDFRDVLDETLKIIIDSGKGIEINTSGYRYKLDSTHPNTEILKRYKELGGEIITVGSDSHKAIDLCKDFDKAYDMLENLGFKYVCLFENRKPKFIEIRNIVSYSA